MTSKSPVKMGVDPAQSARFLETARALGCDEDEAAFRAKLAAIGRQAAKDEAPKPLKPERRKR